EPVVARGRPVRKVSRDWHGPGGPRPAAGSYRLRRVAGGSSSPPRVGKWAGAPAGRSCREPAHAEWVVPVRLSSARGHELGGAARGGGRFARAGGGADRLLLPAPRLALEEPSGPDAAARRRGVRPG